MKDRRPFCNTWLTAPQLLPNLYSVSPQPVKEGWIHKCPLLCPAVVDYFQASQETFSRTDTL